MDENDRCLPDGKKEMQRPGKIENVWKKIHAREKVLYHGNGNFAGPVAVNEKRFCILIIHINLIISIFIYILIIFIICNFV